MFFLYIEGGGVAILFGNGIVWEFWFAILWYPGSRRGTSLASWSWTRLSGSTGLLIASSPSISPSVNLLFENCISQGVCPENLIFPLFAKYQYLLVLLALPIFAFVPVNFSHSFYPLTFHFPFPSSLFSFCIPSFSLHFFHISPQTTEDDITLPSFPGEEYFPLVFNLSFPTRYHFVRL